MTSVPRSVIAAFAVTIMLAGCGGGTSRGNGRQSDAASAKTVWRRAITAVAKGDPAACRYFAHATRTVRPPRHSLVRPPRRARVGYPPHRLAFHDPQGATSS